MDANWKNLYETLTSIIPWEHDDNSSEQSILDYKEEYFALLKKIEDDLYGTYWKVLGPRRRDGNLWADPVTHLTFNLYNQPVDQAFWKEQLEKDFPKSSIQNSESKEEKEIDYLNKYHEHHKLKVKNFIELTLFIKSISKDSFNVKITKPIPNYEPSEHFPVDEILFQNNN